MIELWDSVDGKAFDVLQEHNGACPLFFSKALQYSKEGLVSVNQNSRSNVLLDFDVGADSSGHAPPFFLILIDRVERVGLANPIISCLNQLCHCMRSGTSILIIFKRCSFAFIFLIYFHVVIPVSTSSAGNHMNSSDTFFFFSHPAIVSLCLCLRIAKLTQSVKYHSKYFKRWYWISHPPRNSDLSYLLFDFKLKF